MINWIKPSYIEDAIW